MSSDCVPPEVNARRALSVTFKVTLSGSFQAATESFATAMNAKNLTAAIDSANAVLGKNVAGVSVQSLQAPSVTTANPCPVGVKPFSPLCGECDTELGYAMKANGCFKCDEQSSDMKTILTNIVFGLLLCILVLACAYYYFNYYVKSLDQSQPDVTPVAPQKIALLEV